MLNDSRENESHERNSQPAEPYQGPRVHMLWYAGTLLALAVNAYLLFMTHDLASQRDALAAQIAAVDQKASAGAQESQQRIDSVSAEARQEAAAALDQARADDRKSNAKVASTLAAHQAQQQQVASAVNDLKAAAETATSKLNQVSGDVNSVKGDVNSVKADVASTRSELEGAGDELKRVNGDMGVMSGLIATNATELAELRQLGERNYFEFDIKKTDVAQKIASIRLTLRKTDPKKNKFTLDVFADDKITQKRDRTINEPIQLYVAGAHQPYEIVVNTVNKNEVTGYLATPKAQLANR